MYRKVIKVEEEYSAVFLLQPTYFSLFISKVSATAYE